MAVVDRAPRVYRLVGAPEDPDVDPLRAAWLQLGGSMSWLERTTAPSLVVSHRSAAHLRRLGDMLPHQHDFYATTRLRPRRNDIKLRVRSEIAPSSWQFWGGLPVRTVPAIVDDLLGDHEDESAVAQVVRDALRQGVVRRRSLLPVVQRHAPAYGRSSPGGAPGRARGRGIAGSCPMIM